MPGNTLEPMLDMYIFETKQMIEKLEQIILSSEGAGAFTSAQVNEIFRIMHTIKGSSAMMLFDHIAQLTHAIEDVFSYIREATPQVMDCESLTDLLFESIDFINRQLTEILKGDRNGLPAERLVTATKDYLQALKSVNTSNSAETRKSEPIQQQFYISKDTEAAADAKCYQARVFFQEGCEMENIRAYTLVHNLKDVAANIHFTPSDILENDATADVIRKEGFLVTFESGLSTEEVEVFLDKTIFLKFFELVQGESANLLHINSIVLDEEPAKKPTPPSAILTDREASSTQQGIISVKVYKLDTLMDLMGELVVSRAMVTQNPELVGLSLEGFQKAARHLEKITTELQNVIMSIRMVPLETTFHKMHRVVRDMKKKLNKDVELVLIGQDTEVDKNIIENVSDPLMHLIRNAIDHGIEMPEERVQAGKPATGRITLEAKNTGSEVMILIKDDGRGLDKQKILQKARANQLYLKPEQELSDREIYSFIFLPGFSTKENVTEFSGRGVGMDVVTKNIKDIGGSVYVDSTPGCGTVITLRIPLTLAIIDGMVLAVGNARYIIPIGSIREAFRPKNKDIIITPDGSEMLLVRGQCYPVLRLHRLYKVYDAEEQLAEGIIIIVEHEERTICLLADQLIGEQQVVVKTLPSYIKGIKNVAGIAGCTLLGDGNISLILEIGGIINSEILAPNGC